MTNTSEIKSAAKTVLVRAYDAKVIEPKDLDALVLPILATQNSLWNDLVQTEQGVRARVQTALEAARPEIRELRAQIAQLEDRSGQESVSAKQLASLRRLLKAALTAARREATEQLKIIEEERKTLVKLVVKKTELWWCHGESVVVKYEKARLKAMKEGRKLNFHRFTGLDSLRLRLGHGGLPIADIYARKTTMLKIEDPTEIELGRRLLRKEDGGQRAAITVRIGAKDGTRVPTARLLVSIQHGHELPHHIPLKMVSLRREVTLSRVSWKIALTFSGVQDSAITAGQKSRQSFAEIGLGAAVSGAAHRGLKVGAFTEAKSSVQLIFLPAEWIARMHKIQTLMSELDAEAAHEWLTLAKKCACVHETEEWFRKLTKRMLAARLPKHRALIAFADAHRRAGIPFGNNVDQELQQLAELIKKKGQPIYDMRKRAIEHRNALYKNVAASIAKSTDTLQIVYNQEKLSDRLKELEATERAEFRNMSQLAATSILRKFVEQACLREGVRLEN